MDELLKISFNYLLKSSFNCSALRIFIFFSSQDDPQKEDNMLQIAIIILPPLLIFFEWR